MLLLIRGLKPRDKFIANVLSVCHAFCFFIFISNPEIISLHSFGVTTGAISKQFSSNFVTKKNWGQKIGDKKFNYFGAPGSPGNKIWGPGAPGDRLNW